MIYIAIVLLIIAFYAKGKMDLSASDSFGPKKAHKNKSANWMAKYSEYLEPVEPLWYYLWLYKPKYKERFPFSTTAFVFVTDYWHFMQFIFLNCLFIAFSLMLPEPLFYFIGTRIIYAIIFNLSYEKSI